MANALLTPKVFASTSLAILKNNIVLPKLINTSFTKEFKQIGDTVSVKRAPEFTVRSGSVVSIQDVVEGETTVKIDKQRGIDIQFSSIEETLTVDALLKSRTLKSAMAQLAQQVESDIHGQYYAFNNWVGTPGETINSFGDFLLGPKRLDNLSIPTDGRFAILSTEDNYGLANNFSALYAQRTIAENALERGKLPNIGGVDPYMSQSVVNHTTGTRAGGTVNGAGQVSTYLAVKGSMQQTIVVAGIGAGATVNRGDVFSLAGVFAVNARSKQQQNFLQQFTVLSAATADGAGAVTLTISPALISSGAYQNVSAAPANGATISWMGAANTVYPQSMIMREDAITMASARMSKPYTGESDYATDPDTGLTLRYWRFSDGVNDLHTHRWDLLYGINAVDPRQGVRISGTA